LWHHPCLDDQRIVCRDDILTGGTGNDTYVVDNGGDQVIENSGEGTDTVQSSILYTLGDHVENLTLTGSDDLSGTGNSLNNQITGNSGDNVITGAAGSDTLTGGAGKDRFVFASGFGADTVTDFETGGSTLDFTSYGYTTWADIQANISFSDSGGNAVLTLGSDTVTLNGVASSGLGFGHFYGLAATSGDDTLTGTEGVDNFDGLGGADTLNGNGGTDLLRGGGGNDIIYGGAGNDDLFGDAGNDTLDGGLGDDHIRGGAGRDIFVLSSGFGDDTIADFTVGFDTIDVSALGIADFSTLLANTSDIGGNAVITNGSNTLTLTGVVKSQLLEGDFAGLSIMGTSGDDTLTGFSTDDTINGLAGNDTLRGNSGDDTLNGGADNDRIIGGTGADAMTGGTGDDTFVVDNVGDTTIEAAGEGTDLVESSITWTLSANVENLKLTGFGNTNGFGNSGDNELRGNAANNTITGNSGIDTIYGGHDQDTLYGAGGNDTLLGEEGNDTLDGGTGDDIMTGGTGDDIYVVDSAGDVVTELAAEGNDTVQTEITYTLGSNIENLTLTGSADINGTGTSAAETIHGNSGNNILTGNGGTDDIRGFGGDDTLIGGTAADTLIGGDGADTINGDDGNDWIRGENGNDILNGDGGNDQIFGEAGNGAIDGGAGTDTMTGGDGDDTYYVDTAGDSIVENASEGTDTVIASVNHTLSANVENLTLTGSGTIDGTGNTLDNVITGSTGNNTLTGGAGNDTIDGNSGKDTMIGGTGDDVYYVGSKNDAVTESANEGIDTVFASLSDTLDANVENLTLTGTSGINGTGNGLANVITGNSGSNALSGGGGDDTLIGGEGADTLTGDAGADIFDFNAVSEAGDLITDFETGSGGDQLDLSDLLAALGYLGSDPLADGRVRLQNSGQDTDVEVDTTGSGDYVVLVTLDRTNQGDVTANNWIFS
ncbi:MAG: beta strand repeat-containing protein, partial [Alphaproteobacteria bacterium]